MDFIRKKKHRVAIRNLEKALYQTEDKLEIERLIHYLSKHNTRLAFHPLGDCRTCGSEFG